MTTRTQGKSAQYKAAFWRYHIENHSRSSLSQIRYCRDHALALSTFQHWKRKLNADGLQEKARFYPLTVQATPPQQHKLPSSGLTMRVGNDEVLVELAEEFSARALKKLLVVLRQL
ncbi:IS66 family insertion sequence element accessory protein TnpA [Desulforhopalus singaporensis]|uniref:Transposase n=1 Tax=Desulforhopalus singaporensis TaxID=91360 RepID=A0A1H0W4Q8_9BACT|nr:hypothetical protein [Desulforhopalus singaporensis]SDP85455.1 hypothetical protein SAMN05660330_04407 [Desulforhopalus singaporensis]